MTLKLINNITKSETTITGITDNGNSHINYELSISLPSGMDDGEYTYELIDNNAVLSSGLCQIGNYIRNNNTYTGQTSGYIQYGE